MCEIFGVSSDHGLILNQYLKAFCSHSSEHPDGWGFVALKGNRISLVKEAEKASDSRLFTAVLESEIKASAALAHIRYATVGNVEYDNCHPFTARTVNGRRLTLVHNGTIFEYDPLYPYIKRQSGDTDSERILMYLTDLLSHEEERLGGDLPAKERFRLFEKEITAMSRRNKLNLMLYDGECLYVHTNFRDTMYMLKKEGAVLAATSPLSEEDWKPVPFLTVLAFRNGSLLFEGEGKSEEYIQTEEDLKTIYRNYACL